MVDKSVQCSDEDVNAVLDGVVQAVTYIVDMQAEVEDEGMEEHDQPAVGIDEDNEDVNARVEIDQNAVDDQNQAANNDDDDGDDPGPGPAGAGNVPARRYIPPYKVLIRKRRRNGLVLNDEAMEFWNERVTRLNYLYAELVARDLNAPKISKEIFKRVANQFLGDRGNLFIFFDDLELNAASENLTRDLFNAGQLLAAGRESKTVTDRDLLVAFRDIRPV